MKTWPPRRPGRGALRVDLEIWLDSPPTPPDDGGKKEIARLVQEIGTRVVNVVGIRVINDDAFASDVRWPS
jgi:hypothetical protein